MFIRKLTQEEYNKLKRHVVSFGNNFNGDKCTFYDYENENTWLSLVMCFPDVENRVFICDAFEVMESGERGKTVDNFELDRVLKQLLLRSNKQIEDNTQWNFYMKHIDPIKCDNLEEVLLEA